MLAAPGTQEMDAASSAPTEKIFICKTIASRDNNGRIILTIKSEMQQALDEAFGLWADRTDVPKDGVEYVNRIRSDDRFDEIRKRLYETA